MRRPTTTMAVAVGAAVAATALALPGCWSGAGDDPPLGVALPTRLVANLETFGDCDDLRAYFEEIAAQPLAQPGGGVVAVGGAPRAAVGGAPAGASGGDARVAATSQADAAVSQADAGFSQADAGFSQTNVQEAGVDEPDLVKTDGRTMVAVAQGRLHVVDVSGGAPDVVGSVALPEGVHELFLAGDRAVVLTQAWVFDEPVPLPEPSPEAGPEPDVLPEERARSMSLAPGAGSTKVTAVDVSDPRRPDVAATAEFEGRYVTARLVEGIVRLVLQSMPEFRALQGEASDIGALLPEQILQAGGEGEEAAREPLVACDDVARPPEPSGSGTTTVVTFDVAGSLEVLDTDAVVADAQTVYASAGGLYVATNVWPPAGDLPPDTDGLTTEIHRFDISSPATTEYVGSGQVRGQLLNQWSLSEHDGHLRVATTDGSPWLAGPGEVPSSESFVTVLRLAGDRLDVVGQVGGLGRGERIYAVRYFGDLAFVVTFRETDPLYSIDLSDPAAPEVMGELKIPGFSTYLHPVGEGRLLGVGQDADEQGVTRGTQVSLFDVSDLRNPRRLDHESIPGGSSAVEHDHRAFLWWSPASLALLPVEVYEPVPGAADGLGSPFVGAAGFTVGRDAIEAAGRVAHPSEPGSREGGVPEGVDADVVLPEYWGNHAIQRAVVVGERLYTLSERGILASDLATLATRGFSPF